MIYNDNYQVGDAVSFNIFYNINGTVTAKGTDSLTVAYEKRGVAYTETYDVSEMTETDGILPRHYDGNILFTKSDGSVVDSTKSNLLLLLNNGALQSMHQLTETELLELTTLITQ